MLDFWNDLCYNVTMSVEKMLCQAMIDAGITDPESRDGIDFCVNNCPYEKGCILFDKETSPSIPLARVIKTTFAKRLSEHGVSTRDIALIMRCDKRTIQRYLAK